MAKRPRLSAYRAGSVTIGELSAIELSDTASFAGKPKARSPIFPPEWLPLDAAFVRFRDLTGSTELAAKDLHRALLSSDPPKLASAYRRIRRDGAIEEGELPPSFWERVAFTDWSHNKSHVRILPTPDRRFFPPRTYFFVRRADLDRLPTITGGSEEPSPKEPGRKRGRKVEFKWDDLFAEVIRRVHEDGIPDSDNKFAEDLVWWCDEQNFKDYPQAETIRKKLRTWLSRVRGGFNPN